MKPLFSAIHVDWALACLRHSLCLGGWASPLPWFPPTRACHIAPGTSGILWSEDGAPVQVTAPLEASDAALSGLRHSFSSSANAAREGLTSEDYAHYMGMLPPNLRLRQRKRLKLLLALKQVSQQGGDALALVRQMFPHAGEREIAEPHALAPKPVAPTRKGAEENGAGDDAGDDGLVDVDDGL